ncbi:MAG: hypothetical protein RLZZ26_230 [Candidatus Parcubacteria bacterium]|jgi:hypothetical protein
MKKYFLLCALVVVAIVGAFISHAVTPAASLPAAVNGVSVPFTELAHGDRSDVTRRANFLITSSEELSLLWKMVNTSSAKPAVDFTTDMVIAVFAGTEPTLGYSISVANVSDADRRVVAVTVSKPGGSCVEGDTVTTPYQIIVLPKTALPFTHVDRVTTVSCLQ